MAASVTCPSCGNIIKPETRSPQLLVCPACNTVNLLENGRLEDVGKSACLTEEPSIFEIHKRYKYKDWKFTPVGRVRYDFGDGYWEEWYVRDDAGKEAWVSVDEGEIAIEKPFGKNLKLPAFEEIKVGGAIMINRQRMTVIEKNSCTCVGAQGELPFKAVIGETYNYIDLLGQRRASFTIEYEEDNKVACFKGIWIDAFDITEV